MRWLGLVLVLSGCSGWWESYKADVSRRAAQPHRNPVPARECYDRDNCSDADEVCVISQGRSTGSCVKVR